MRTRSFLPSLLTASAMLTSLGCDPPVGSASPTQGSASPATSAAAASASAVDADILVTVNGVPIREHDLHFVLARANRRRGKGVDEEKAKEALDKIIDEELKRQQAEALGLDEDADYLRKLRFMQAPVNDFQRSELTKAFDQKEVIEKANLDEAEARKHFEDNSARYKTEFGVLQILVKGDETKIQEMKRELDGGAAFEKVAATLFASDLPETDKPPWDMGLLRWSQLPGPWRDAIGEMKEGEVSGILRGPKERAWIIKLAKRQVNEAITFDQVKLVLIEDVGKAKAIELRRQTTDDLRKKASIVVVREPGAMPPPPEPDD